MCRKGGGEGRFGIMFYRGPGKRRHADLEKNSGEASSLLYSVFKINREVSPLHNLENE